MTNAARPLGVQLLWIAVGLLCLRQVAATEPAGDDSRRAAQAALSGFNDLIGGWRGVGQLRRGSNRGAWRQNAEWVWDFQQESVGIRYQVKDGQLVSSGRVTWDASAKQYVLSLTTPEGGKRDYRGTEQENRITLLSEPDAEGITHRLSITKLNDKRTLVLHEKRSAGQQSFFRVAEVGYTREGTRLATPGGNGPECIVTGGAGTIRVQHNGKAYYVCCTGCKQAFEADPEGIIAEAAQRRNRPQ